MCGKMQYIKYLGEEFDKIRFILDRCYVEKRFICMDENMEIHEHSMYYLLEKEEYKLRSIGCYNQMNGIQKIIWKNNKNV